MLLIRQKRYSALDGLHVSSGSGSRSLDGALVNRLCFLDGFAVSLLFCFATPPRSFLHAPPYFIDDFE
jgi:hypothetical protein